MLLDVLGRNHALYGLTGWIAAWPILASSQASAALAMPVSAEVFGVTCAVAAGASVIPDLDHPDSRPSKHFGILSKVIARGISQAAGGHRQATHSLLFATLLAALTAAVGWLPAPVGQSCAALACGFCCSIGLALIGPSMGIRVPAWVSIATAAGSGWWVWNNFYDIRWVLPLIAAYGVIIHIACDFVTKGGVPILWPITRRRIALHLFRVGGPGENIAALIGFASLVLVTWRAINVAF